MRRLVLFSLIALAALPAPAHDHDDDRCDRRRREIIVRPAPCPLPAPRILYRGVETRRELVCDDCRHRRHCHRHPRLRFWLGF